VLRHAGLSQRVRGEVSSGVRPAVGPQGTAYRAAGAMI